MTVGVGGCAVGSPYGVPEAHWDEAVYMRMGKSSAMVMSVLTWKTSSMDCEGARCLMRANLGLGCWLDARARPLRRDMAIHVRAELKRARELSYHVR